MTDNAQPLPDPVIEAPKRWIPSVVWIVPVVAALVGLSLLVHTFLNKGPGIQVTFATAEGIEAGKTKVKFKNVDIGQVTEVTLSPDRAHVVVSIELVKEAKAFAAVDSRFWVVKPRLAGANISGLGTLVSGSYIGVDGGHSDEKKSAFTGLEDPPVIASDAPGRRFVLNAKDIGSIDVGSPIYYRRIEAGHVERFALNEDGEALSVNVFIKAPYDRYVTEATRFWHASGVDLQLGASGLKLETQSLASILLGGIAFEAQPGIVNGWVAEGRAFSLAANRVEAMKIPDGEPETVLLRFNQSVRGLSVGAPVDFRGTEIGKVTTISVAFDRSSGDFYSPVTVEIFPQRLGEVGRPLSEQTSPAERRAILERLIRHGLRAQLRSGNLLTGQLLVAFDMFPDAPKVTFDGGATPTEIPTVPGDLQELQQQLQAIVRKIDKIPFDRLGQDADRVLVSLNATLQRLDGVMRRADAEILPEIRDTMRQMNATMTTLQGSVDGDAPLQQDTRQALRGLAEATRSLKALSDAIERNPDSLIRGRREQTR